jgi:SM-20-related protein
VIDHLEIKSFLDQPACTALRAELRQVIGTEATVTGSSASGLVQPLVRRATRLTIPPRINGRVTQLLMQRKGELERHFGIALSTCEEPQFLRYQTGDFFVAHQDGNTPLIHDHTRFRKISAVIFLSTHAEDPSPESYGGGALVLYGPYCGPDIRIPFTPEAGSLVCFRAETTHEVIPVTHGERFTIVSWYL